MSELLQSGQHPDADVLNAFVEQALPPHERGQTLAHLAVCPDCRAVVALSLPPVEEVPEIQVEPVRRPWFSGWNLAWPAAAALATVGLLTIHFRNAVIGRRSTPTSSEVAESRLPVVPLAPSTQSAPTAKPSAPSVDKSQLTSRAGAGTMGAVDVAKLKKVGPVINRKSIDSLPLAGRNVMDLPQRTATSSNGLANGQSRDSEARATAGVMGGIGTAAMPAQPATAVPMDRFRTGVDNSLSDTANAAAPTAAMSAPQVQSLFRQTLLPSRLPAVSMAANGHLVLAIDAQNKVFFSMDDGKHWNAVPAQWQGKAVRVALTSALAPVGSGTATVAVKARSSVAMPAAPSTDAAATVANSTLTGAVTDTSGSAIANAPVVLRKTGTTITRTVKTDSSGRYVADGLAPGAYEVEAQAPGFKKQTLDVTLIAAQQNVGNLTLQVGAASQTVAVEAAAAPLLTESSVLGETIKEPSTAGVPSSVFEITTDSGDRWTSSDGRSWKHK